MQRQQPSPCIPAAHNPQTTSQALCPTHRDWASHGDVAHISVLSWSQNDSLILHSTCSAQDCISRVLYGPWTCSSHTTHGYARVGFGVQRLGSHNLANPSSRWKLWAPTSSGNIPSLPDCQHQHLLGTYAILTSPSSVSPHLYSHCRTPPPATARDSFSSSCS